MGEEESSDAKPAKGRKAARPAKPAKARKPWWRRKRWWTLAILAGLLVWLDGPGWRWIGEKAAAHFLPKAGLEGGLQLRGRLTSGEIGIDKVDLGGSATLQLVGLDRARVRYKLSDIIHGRIQAVELHGLRAEIDLAGKPDKEEEEPDDEEAEPSDPAEVLADLRERLLPADLDLTDISVVVRRGEELLFALEPTSLQHRAGEEDFVLDLGRMEFTGDLEVAAQEARLSWKPEELLLDQLELAPDLSLIDVRARFAAGADPDYALGLAVDTARFALATDLKTAELELTEGPLVARRVAGNFKLELPLDAKLDRLEVTVRGIEGGTESIEADALLGLSGIDYEGWTSQSLALAAKLEGDAVEANLQGDALGSRLDLDVGARIDRAAGMLPLSAQVDGGITELEKALATTAARLAPAEESAEAGDTPEPPESSLQLGAEVDFTEGAPQEVRGKLALVPVDPDSAPPLNVAGTWGPEAGVTARLELPGVAVGGEFDPAATRYEATATVESFDPQRLDPWLAPFRVTLPTGMEVSTVWSGSGVIEDNTHEGGFELQSFEWRREGVDQPLMAFANAEYAWPVSLELASLNVQQGAHKIESRVNLRDRVLRLDELSWSDGDDRLFEGTATVPVPEDPADWRALLQETRPLEVDLKSANLPLTKLHDFLPPETRFPADSRVQLDVQLSGTPREPEIAATLSGRELGLESTSDLPRANLNLKANSSGRTLKVEGEVGFPEYDDIVLSAVAPWSPGEWAEDPDSLQDANIDATARINDFDLSKLLVLLDGAGIRKLGGTLNAEVVASGPVRELSPQATLTLRDGSFRSEDDSMPRAKDAAFTIRANGDRVDIESLSVELSGGTLALGGTLELEEFQPSAIDLSLTGRGLPAMRNELMIVRLDTDLTLEGPWERATLAGSVTVDDSLFYKDLEIIPIGIPTSQPAAPPSLPAADPPEPAELMEAVPEPFRNWPLDLSIKTGRPFLILGNLATGEVYLDIDVGGTAGAPAPDGAATLREVEAVLPFSTLTINEGKVKFRPGQPFDPLLDIRGESTIRPYEIRVYILGPVSNPQILPTSSPPLPDTEIMTLIATGATTAGVEDSQAATSRAIQLFVNEVRRGRVRYTKWMRPALSLLDRVDFQVGAENPYSGEKFNSATIELDDNWLIEAGINDEGNTRTTLNYLFRFR